MTVRVSPTLRMAASLLLVGGASARADDWALSGAFVAMSAPALPSLVLGGSLDLSRDLTGPFDFTFRVGGGTVSDANENWDLTQLHLLATGGLGISGSLGVGLLSAELDVGALGVSETARRHQFARLTAANIPDRERTSFAMTPYASLRFAIAVQFIETWRLRLSVEPNLTWLAVNEVATPQPGLVTALGVRHAF